MSEVKRYTPALLHLGLDHLSMEMIEITEGQYYKAFDLIPGTNATVADIVELAKGMIEFIAGIEFIACLDCNNCDKSDEYLVTKADKRLKVTE